MASELLQLGDRCTQGIVLLVLIVVGNFTANTLNVHLIAALKNARNKYLAIWLIIYFSVLLTSPSEPKHPLHNMGLSLLVWAIYVALNAMRSQHLFVFVSILIAILVVINEYESYNKRTNHIPPDTISRAKGVLYVIVLCLLSVSSGVWLLGGRGLSLRSPRLSVCRNLEGA